MVGMKPFPEYKIEWYDTMSRINMRSPFLLTQACLPLLEAAGTAASHASVINIASIDGIRVPTDNDWARGPARCDECRQDDRQMP